MTKTCNLSIFVDLGASLIKVLYQWDELRVLLLPPYVGTMSARRLKDVVSASPNGLAEELCWLEVAGELVAVGALASGIVPSMGLKQRKLELGLYRVLAVLGIVRETLELGASFECNMWVALPVAEYGDRDRFMEQLRTQAAAFVCRGQEVECQFRLLDVQVEGMGLVRDRRSELLSERQSPSHRIVALMCGHRNLSVLHFSGSSLQLESCHSSEPGFINAVEIAARALSVEPSTSELTEIVALGKRTYRFAGEVRPRSTAEAVAEAREAYWAEVAAYLQEHLPGGEFEVVAAGGALAVIQANLESFLAEVGLAERLSLASKRQQALCESLPELGMSVGSGMCLRLLDAYVGLQALLALGKRNGNAKKGSSGSGATVVRQSQSDVVQRLGQVL